MTRTAYLVLLFVLLCASARGQSIYGSSVVNIDPTSNTGTADCETDLDSTADDGFTAARVTCQVTDENNNLIASGSYSDDGDYYGYAEVNLAFTANPGSTYTVTAGHTAVFTVPFDEPDGGYPLYYDEYNFENYIESPTQDLADSYVWYGPGPEQQTRRKTLTLPPTVAKKHYPNATISIAFTNPRDPNDHLDFTIYSHECSNNLGLQDCSATTGWWNWSIEASFQVSDDASNWTISQSKSSLTNTGTELDRYGNYYSYSDSSPGGPDGPFSPYIQQTPGTTTGFWIDSPGRAAGVAPDGGAILTMDWLQHYSVQVCSKTMAGVCASKAWFVNLKAAGGQLSTSSSAGYE